MLTTLAATFAFACSVITLLRSRRLSADRSLVRYLGLLLAAASVCMALRIPGLVDWATARGLGPLAELAKHTIGAVALGLLPVYLYPGIRAVRRAAAVVVPLGAAAMIGSFAAGAPWDPVDLDVTYSDPAMAAYWLSLWSLTIAGTATGLVAMLRHLRRGGFALVQAEIAATCAGLLAWGISGSVDWISALAHRSPTAATSAGSNPWATLAVTTIALGLGASLYTVMIRARARRADLLALIEYVRLVPMDTDRTQPLAIVAQDHLSVIQDYALPTALDVSSEIHDRLAVIDGALERALAGRFPARTAAWPWAGDPDALAQLGRHLRRRTPAADQIARAWSTATQPAVAIPASCVLLGALYGRTLSWTIVMGLGFSAPILVLALARLAGLLRTLRITGRTRVALLAAGIAYELGFIAMLQAVDAPSELTHVAAALVAGAAVLGTVNMFTNISAHTSIWAILTGSLLPHHPLLAAAAVVMTVSCAWARVRSRAHTVTQAYALPWLTALATVIAQLA